MMKLTLRLLTAFAGLATLVGCRERPRYIYATCPDGGRLAFRVDPKDATTAIQAAMNSACGGEVFFPPGHYETTPKPERYEKEQP